MNLISDELNDALCEQLGQEKYNSNFYLFIAGYLRNKGLNNLAKIFEKQHDEEFNHSKMIYEFLIDLNGQIELPEINRINLQINDIREIAKLYLEKEINTTQSLESIKKLAIEENNPVTEEFLRKMISLQKDEYKESCEFYDKAEMFGSDWKFVFLWDTGLN